MSWTPPDDICVQGDGVKRHGRRRAWSRLLPGLDIAQHVLQVHGADAAGRVLFLGQRKALAIAVKGGQTRRRWSKLREWLGSTCPVNPSLLPAGERGR